MMTVKQVSSMTGVSVRTLQFYDEIGLFKPTRVTDAGYRLYDEKALGVLQQILFFKELDFTLKEIRVIMENPEFDQAAAFKKQRELIQIKRDRLNSLLGLLDKLIKGEESMEFKEFDMSTYFEALADFKKMHTNEIIRQFGSAEAFDDVISELKSNEEEIAEMAVRQYGSLENFTDAMKKNLQEFLAGGPAVSQIEVSGLIEKTEAITKRLTADLSKDAASAEIQKMTEELINFTKECSRGVDMGENYWTFMADQYLTNPAYTEVNDRKYGEGASKFMGLAIQAYVKRQGSGG